MCRLLKEYGSIWQHLTGPSHVVFFVVSVLEKIKFSPFFLFLDLIYIMFMQPFVFVGFFLCGTLQDPSPLKLKGATVQYYKIIFFRFYKSQKGLNCGALFFSILYSIIFNSCENILQFYACILIFWSF